MSELVAQMKERVSEFNPDEDDHYEQELYKAFIEFADAYNTFNNEKNIENWRNAKDKQKKVLHIGNIQTNLTPYMNAIWKHSPEFDDIHQNRWIYSELDRLHAPVAERYNPYSYIKRREEERRRQELHRQEEEPQRQEYEPDKKNSKMYPIPTTRIQALNVLNLKENATRREIRKAYLRNSMMNHPDKNPDEQIESTARQQQVTEAYNLLKGGKTRRTMQRKNMKKSKKSKKTKSMRH
jgi:hypothetical protein